MPTSLPTTPGMRSLFDLDEVAPVAAPERDPDATVELTKREKWHAFHTANPHVFDALERLVSKLIDQGVTRVSPRWLLETFRMDGEATNPDGDYRINNNHAAYYGRALVEAHPTWADVIPTRRLKRVDA